MWKYDIAANTWEIIWGNRTKWLPTNYDVPYPGGLMQYAMVIDSKDTYIYIFGGYTNPLGSEFLFIN